MSFKDVEWDNVEEYQNFICSGYNGTYKTIENISTTTVNYMYFNKTTPEKIDIPCVIDQDITNKAKLIANMMETSIINYYTKVQYLAALDWSEEDYRNLVYTDLIEVIKIMEEHNLPYDPYYASIATEYNKDVYNKIVKFDPTINSLLNNYDKTPLIVNRHCDRYHYDYPFATQYMRLNILYDFIESDEKINKDMEYIYHDFMRGISVYLMKNKVFETRVSNAFVKLWEIYIEHKVLNKDGINAFHMCEAPGQWINTTKTFIDKIYGKNTVKYNWLANSLNPNNPENIKKYGNNIINDTYGFMKRDKEKWLFGDDDTGDITKSYNIMWYREHLKDKNINLVTGDAGLPTDMPLEYLQKLDYAQCVLTLATSSTGANCVIKCFSPYMKNNNKTLESTGFFANLIYLYYCCYEKLYLYKPYTSRSQGGEFYIVGESFTHISEENLKELLEVLDNFSENINFVCKKDISPKFEVLIENFLQQLIKYNSESLKMAFFLNQLANDTSDVFKFKKLISKDEIYKIQNKKFRMFCEKFKLI
jgi:23S rRNA U2552 (ribose-2'-O)-methylase RlmE/FtsJ